MPLHRSFFNAGRREAAVPPRPRAAVPNPNHHRLTQEEIRQRLGRRGPFSAFVGRMRPPQLAAEVMDLQEADNSPESGLHSAIRAALRSPPRRTTSGPANEIITNGSWMWSSSDAHETGTALPDAHCSFRRIKSLGSGAYGAVSLAEINGNPDLVVAIKDMHIAHSAPDEGNLASFHREVDVLQRLHHPNIVSFYGTFTTATGVGFVIEYAPGGSLRSLAETRPFTDDQLRTTARDVASGLAYCHSSHVVHRDLKGHNLLLDAYGSVKLTDFGSVRVSDFLKRRGSNDFTLQWAAPETLAEQTPAPPVDIWSLGCTLIELATNAHPYAGNDLDEQSSIMLAISSGVKPLIPQHLSQPAKDFISLCFELDPAQRATAKDLLNHPWLQQPQLERVDVWRPYGVTIAAAAPVDASTSYPFSLKGPVFYKALSSALADCPAMTSLPFVRSSTAATRGDNAATAILGVNVPPRCHVPGGIQGAYGAVEAYNMSPSGLSLATSASLVKPDVVGFKRAFLSLGVEEAELPGLLVDIGFTAMADYHTKRGLFHPCFAPFPAERDRQLPAALRFSHLPLPPNTELGQILSQLSIAWDLLQTVRAQTSLCRASLLAAKKPMHSWDLNPSERVVREILSAYRPFDESSKSLLTYLFPIPPNSPALVPLSVGRRQLAWAYLEAAPLATQRPWFESSNECSAALTKLICISGALVRGILALHTRASALKSKTAFSAWTSPLTKRLNADMIADVAKTVAQMSLERAHELIAPGTTPTAELTARWAAFLCCVLRSPAPRVCAPSRRALGAVLSICEAKFEAQSTSSSSLAKTELEEEAQEKRDGASNESSATKGISSDAFLADNDLVAETAWVIASRIVGNGLGRASKSVQGEAGIRIMNAARTFMVHAGALPQDETPFATHVGGAKPWSALPADILLCGGSAEKQEDNASEEAQDDQTSAQSAFQALLRSHSKRETGGGWDMVQKDVTGHLLVLNSLEQSTDDPSHSPISAFMASAVHKLVDTIVPGLDAAEDDADFLASYRDEAVQPPAEPQAEEAVSVASAGGAYRREPSLARGFASASAEIRPRLGAIGLGIAAAPLTVKKQIRFVEDLSTNQCKRSLFSDEPPATAPKRPADPGSSAPGEEAPQNAAFSSYLAGLARGSCEDDDYDSVTSLAPAQTVDALSRFVKNMQMSDVALTPSTRSALNGASSQWLPRAWTDLIAKWAGHVEPSRKLPNDSQTHDAHPTTSGESDLQDSAPFTADEALAAFERALTGGIVTPSAATSPARTPAPPASQDTLQACATPLAPMRAALASPLTGRSTLSP